MNKQISIFLPKVKELKYIVDLLNNKSHLSLNEIPSWQRFIELVKEHRIIQSIYPKLSEYQSQIPEPYFSILQNEFLRSKYILLNFASESILVSNALKKNGVESILFKGVFQAYRYQKAFTTRHCKDIDIIVRKNDVEKAKKVLASLNYWSSDNIGYTPKQQEAFSNLLYHREFIKSESNTQIELHWNLHPNDAFSFSEKYIWQRSSSIYVNGSPIKLLSSVDNFIQLVLHGTRHGWFRLNWLLDIKQILNDENEKFLDEVLKEAEALNVLNPMLVTIKLVETVFDLKLIKPNQFDQIEINYFSKIINVFTNNIENNGTNFNSIKSLKIKIENLIIQYMLDSLPSLKSESSFFFNKPQNWAVFYFPDSVFELNYLAAPFIWLYRKIVGR